MRINRVLYWSLIAFLSVVILVCGGLIAHKFISDAREQAYYDDLLSTMPSMDRPDIPDAPITVPLGPSDTVDPSDPGPSRPHPVYDESEILFGYRSLYAINNDMVGFIEIPGTSIRYPVVQSPYQANYYLRRNFLKVSATCGTIYVREACDVNKPSDNVTIYGHKMTNGTMFADLHKYKSKSFWEDYSYIYFDTLTEQHAYEIFAVFQMSANRIDSFNYHLFDDAKDEAEYNQFVNTCKVMSYYDTGITPAYGEKLITLSTCDKDVDDGRFVVVARQVY